MGQFGSHLGVWTFWFILGVGNSRKSQEAPGGRKTSPCTVTRFPLGQISEDMPNLADECGLQPLAAEGFELFSCLGEETPKGSAFRIRTAKGFEFSAACGPKGLEG